MTISDLRAPFPYFGGKKNAAPIVWERFGNPGAYIEPHNGSAHHNLRLPIAIDFPGAHPVCADCQIGDHQ